MPHFSRRISATAGCLEENGVDGHRATIKSTVNTAAICTSPDFLLSPKLVTLVVMPLPSDVQQLADMAVPDRFPRLVAGMGCSSLLMSIYTILFQAPSGVLFEQHPRLFYQILLLLVVLGTIQVAVGFFLQYRDAPVPERIGKTVILTISALLLILTATIGGFSFKMKL
jgi:hypothetical protein